MSGLQSLLALASKGGAADQVTDNQRDEDSGQVGSDAAVPCGVVGVRHLGDALIPEIVLLPAHDADFGADRDHLHLAAIGLEDRQRRLSAHVRWRSIVS